MFTQPRKRIPIGQHIGVASGWPITLLLLQYFEFLVFLFIFDFDIGDWKLPKFCRYFRIVTAVLGPVKLGIASSKSNIIF
ncbi:hypothetical protein VTL71DRAFT_12666 [Oculimacula yallundae]|uniref:Uncharacterized protein n=1 Tax=Oculimacula yallundae TaxID=86028 RepID=A0ABR4CQE9_9HELO